MSTTGARPVGAPADGQVDGPKFSFGPRPTVGLGAAGKAVAEDISTLVKAEIALAKAELAEDLKAQVAGPAAFAAAGVAGWLALQGVLITAGFALALVLPAWAAAGIVTAVLLVIAAGAALIGKRKLKEKKPAPLQTTKANVEKDVAWTKSHLLKQ